MFKELAHHVGAHIAQHPKESVAAIITTGKAIAPVAVAAAPYVVGLALVGGAIYIICRN